MPTPSPRPAPAVAASPTVFSPSRNHIRRSLGEGSGAGAVVLCTVQQGSPLQQVLQQDGALTSHADGDWMSAEDVSARARSRLLLCSSAPLLLCSSAG